MIQDLQNLRDTLIEHLHGLADEQDHHARSAVRESDIHRETAHRGAAIGLRMAAGLVSERLSCDLLGSALELPQRSLGPTLTLRLRDHSMV